MQRTKEPCAGAPTGIGGEAAPRSVSLGAAIASASNVAALSHLKLFEPKNQPVNSRVPSAVLAISATKDRIVCIYEGFLMGVHTWDSRVDTNGVPYHIKFARRLVPLLPNAVAVAQPEVCTAKGSSCFAVPAAGLFACKFLLSCGYWDGSLRGQAIEGASSLGDAEVGYSHVDMCTCVVAASDGVTVVTGSVDCSLRVWALGSPATSSSESKQNSPDSGLLQWVHVLVGHVAAVSAVDVTSDLDLVASGATDGRLLLHDLRSGAFIRELAAGHMQQDSHTAAIRLIAISRSGHVIVHTWCSPNSEGGHLRVYSVNGCLVAQVDTPEKLYAMRMTTNPDTLDLLVTGGENGVLCSRDPFTLQVILYLL
jgi:WD40 repeat protein